MVLNTQAIRDRVNASVQEQPVNGCAARKFSFRAMGTLCQVTFVPCARVTGDQFRDATLRWVADFEAKYSRFLPDSLIGRINQNAGNCWTEIDEETERLLALCGELFFLTRGAFDPTALPLIELWNWKANPPVVPAAAAMQAAREISGWNKVQRRKGGIFLTRTGMKLDMGGIGKEYAVDIVTQIAAQHGIADVLVDFGQDVRAQGRAPGKPAWHIGLEDPASPGRCWTGVAALNMAVATSGDYLRRFEIGGRRYGHIIDPRSGEPVHNGCRSVSVIAPTCTVAGALSTSAFILGPQEGLNLLGTQMGVEGCIITETSRHQTRKFHEHLTR